jgi:2-keto-4-pentenoate hydratase/2-oxohepta-3-ene-1,7-dioic acid hydratase in catechol pathway
MDARQPPTRFARYRLDTLETWGRLAGETLARLSAAPWEGAVESGQVDALESVRLLAPALPTKIVCVGLNYRAHIAESQTVLPDAKSADEPLLFLKPPSAVIGPGDAIRYPPGVTRLDPEAELAIVIGRRASRVSAEEAPGFVAGYTCFNDVSARNYQRSDGQWARAKGFDTFAPIGPWLVSGVDPAALEVTCRVSGELRQRGHTRDLIFPVPELIRHISHIMTLEPGDVIATGTPAGVAPVQVGDRIEVAIDGIGVLENSVEAWT